jgi:lipoprotein-anchoring transpeptidase ErfK/SrfK
VRADQVQLERLDHRVTIDLAARQLTVWVDDQVQRVVDVAVGSAENPTPTGSFFVVDKLDTTNDAGAYGPYAFGLSAHSDTLTEFAGGDGQIGIHGTNDPSSIGRAVSHGCVRLPNDAITQLAAELPLGTPVVIS